MEQTLANTTERLDNAPLSNTNVELLHRFKNDLLVTVSTHRVNQVLNSFITLAPLIDFRLDEAEEADIKQVVGQVNRNQINAYDYSPHTRKELKKSLQRFYSWHTGDDAPPMTRFMDVWVKERDRVRTDPAELPDRRTVEALAKACTNPRDAALVHLLFDGGLRISEALHVKWKHLLLNGDRSLDKVKVQVSKTKPRTVPLIFSPDTLNTWKQEHPGPGKNAYVFTAFHNDEQLSYSAAYAALRRGRRKSPEPERCGNCNHALEDPEQLHRIPEKVKTNPHAFRKGRATDLARRGMNAYMMMQFFGWKKVETAREYIRLASTDLEEAVKTVHPATETPGKQRQPVRVASEVPRTASPA